VLDGCGALLNEDLTLACGGVTIQTGDWFAKLVGSYPGHVYIFWRGKLWQAE